MNIQKLSLIASARRASGLVVLIDVLRACTTIPIVLSRGASEIRPVLAEPELSSDNGLISIGEGKNGVSTRSYDFNNSPSEVLTGAFSNKTVVLKTNNATEAIFETKATAEVVFCAFVNIEAVAKYIQSQNPETVSLLALGRLGKPGTEDELCSSALVSILQKRQFHPIDIREQVMECDCAILVSETLGKPEDVEIALNFNAYPIVPKLFWEDGQPVIRKI